MALYQSVPSRDGHGKPKKRISGLFDITCSAATLILPMLVNCAVLLGLVLYYRVQQQEMPLGSLPTLNSTADSAYYYVEFSATRLIFVASWSSTLATVLSMAILTLWSFPVAASFLNASDKEAKGNLPRPYQLAITLSMLNGGGPGSLWRWAKYPWGWRRQREKQGHALFSVGLMVVLATLLGIFVVAADTWLHISTITVPFVNTTSVKEADLPKFSFRLSENCTSATNPVSSDSGAPCALNPSRFNTWLMNPRQAFEVLDNASSIMTVSMYGDNTPYAYLGVSSLQDISSIDFRATSYGLQTQCKTLTKQCNMTNPVQASTPFRCNDVFYGNPGNGNRGIDTTYNAGADYRFQFWSFVNSELTELPDGSNGYPPLPTNSMINPFYAGFSALTFYGGSGGTGSDWADYFVYSERGGTAFVVSCESSSYDVSYEWINGKVERFDAQLSNTTIGMLASTIMARTFEVDTPHGLYLQNAMIAATMSSNSSDEFAATVALAYSKATLALFSEVVIPHSAISAQTRDIFLVAKVPMAALYTLIGTNMLFVVLGIILLVTALVVRGDGVDDVQARHSIAGIVADRFEPERREMQVGEIEELFMEHQAGSSSRVAIAATRRGGFAYESIS